MEIEGNVSALQNQQEADGRDHDDLVNVQILPQCDKQKHDTHWDFLMKEMMWLSADFISERSRQMGKAKKMSVSVRQYHKHKESRLARQAAEAHTKRVKLAAKIARDVKGWWNKLDRIVAYKQRVEMDQMKQKRMDKHLVFLVRQTEKYGNAMQNQGYEGEGSDDMVNGSFLTVEQALAEDGWRKRKSNAVRNMNIASITDDEDSASILSKEEYGYFSASDSASLNDNDEYSPSDASYDIDDISIDDEESMHYNVDEEVRLLHKEANIPINDLLQSLKAESFNKNVPITRSRSIDSTRNRTIIENIISADTDYRRRQ